MRTKLGAIFVLFFVLWAGTRIVKSIQFYRNCGGYLKRAADANTVKLAATNLATAVEFARVNNLTEGYTSILWTTPDEDVSFWYTNISVALTELQNTRPDASRLEQTNVLMKLRETLLDQQEHGTNITVPSGISIFPNNGGYCLWGLLSFIFVVRYFSPSPSVLKKFLNSW